VTGHTHGPTTPLLSAEHATRLLDEVVHERVRELIDFGSMLDFEQELWSALVECGLPRERIPAISADMIARALVRVGEEHKKVAADPISIELVPRTPD
jgi:hypothetical protein